MSSQKLRFGIVGYGSIAEDHAQALRAAGADVVAVGGPNRDSVIAFARRFDIPVAVTELAEMWRSREVEAVVIASPNAAHAEQATAALQAGKHVLCEIPLALSLDQARGLAEAAAGLGLTLMVAHTQRFWLPVIAARERVLKNALTPRHVIARFLLRRRENVSWKGRLRTWTDSLLWHHGCHAIDTSLHLLGGDVREVSGLFGPPSFEAGLPVDISVTMRLSTGALATIALSYNTVPPSCDYLLVCEEETLCITPSTLTSNGAPILEIEPDVATNEPVMAQAAEFIAAIREQRRPSVSAEDVLPTMAVLQRIQNAASLRAP